MKTGPMHSARTQGNQDGRSGGLLRVRQAIRPAAPAMNLDEPSVRVHACMHGKIRFSGTQSPSVSVKTYS